MFIRIFYSNTLASLASRSCAHIFPPTERRRTTHAVVDSSSGVPLLLNRFHNSHPSPIISPAPVPAQLSSLPFFLRQAHHLPSKGIVPSSSLLYGPVITGQYHSFELGHKQISVTKWT
ncbi:hypothetical protein Y032_0160g3349 [Ancylostoma ceylanicum]|uniref:Uncharacterized protein n=1 Tax=Ancylostoma ceylanicum TaxID=53326 RepID=A0A016SY97_9BILA|nr:hypothetical protein Y032_0160g3349 [Ancylostoma ceylanicum]